MTNLREILTDAKRAHGLTMGDLTVLADQNDPYRVDTPAGHRDAAWFARAVELHLPDGQTIHLRGMHYVLVSVEATKPNGEPYTNTEKDWKWLQADPAKAARWLGYVPFERIVDERNTPPIVRILERVPPEPYVTVGFEVEVPDVEDMVPTANVAGFDGEQAFRIVLYGEKTSLEPVLAPIAEDHDCDLFLMTGEMSDTYLHTMAKAGAEDGRPMVVLTFCDCDPSGWQMPVSIARKLQAFQHSQFPDLQVRVYPIALTPDHVREYGLPSTMLKDTEQRADAWMAATGTAQTEIDALAALQPDLLRGIALDAVAPFYDYTLAARVLDARRAYLVEWQAAVDANTDAGELERLREEMAGKLDDMREQIADMNDAMRLSYGDATPPPVSIPDAVADGEYDLGPLFDSDDDYVTATRRLIQHRAYQDGEL